MSTLMQYLPYSQATFANYKSWAQGLSTAWSTFGWVWSGDAACVNGTNSYGTATITNVAITTNVLTLTFSGPTQSSVGFIVGQACTLTGLTTATFLNGQVVVVLSATTTTLTANFIHANYGSAADTGTITATYGYNTITNVPDSSTTFPTLGTLKFRGAYMGNLGTPTFTQKTNNQIILTLNNALTTANVGQSLILASYTNTTYNGTWPILSSTSTTITLNSGATPGADIALTANAAGTTFQQFVGSASNAAVNYDVTMYGGDLYFTRAATVSNSIPGTSTTNWNRLFIEMWKSNDTLSSTLPMYVRLCYSDQGALPQVYLDAGTATDSGLNISQNRIWSGGTSTPFGLFAATTVLDSGNALWECDFAGGTNGSRFSMLMWRTYNLSSATPTCVLNIERCKDNSGNDTDAYFTVVFGGAAQSTGSGGAQFQGSMLKPGTGAVPPTLGGSSGTNTLAPATISIGQASSYNNSIPVLPVFPIVGFVGNPMLNVLSARSSDIAEGIILSITVYAASHSYLFSRSGAAQGGPFNFGATNGAAAGIRWE